jgi:hypothetical protein
MPKKSQTPIPKRGQVLRVAHGVWKFVHFKSFIWSLEFGDLEF